MNCLFSNISKKILQSKTIRGKQEYQRKQQIVCNKWNKKSIKNWRNKIYN